MQPSAPGHPRLTRSRTDRLVAGVAGGIAANTRLSPTLIRIIFVLLLPINGLGALLYAAFWAVLPAAPGEPARRSLLRLAPFLAAGLVLMVISTLLNNGGIGMTVGWLVALVAVGAGIIWHQSDPDRRQRWSDQSPSAPWLAALSDGDRRIYLLRFLAGGVLVAVGILGLVFLYSPVVEGVSWADMWRAVAFALVALAGVGLVAAPVLWRTLVALRTEREGRIREQERAELAAMVHDQVLHTLALIQRNAGDPAAVQRIARGQERSLRNWLYQPTGSPTEHFAAALQQAAAEVEDTYGIAVEAVVVGDRAVDDKVAAIVAAAREALVNAARHAQVKSVSLYAEAEPTMLSVFVRDRGKGFDPASVEERRHGVRGSIIGRMARHGGQAEIRSEIGEGTEVRLTMAVTSPREPKEEKA
ncbi:histidine kinase [Catellatospora sp. IY07-71]|uniref:ATP-binding protein n=1 Tax=Catellatospora sp. IY07-71 TaxID=2728827 RepID=UPI001BB6296E|nr:ATP-binding protein [Catellatospora sp. IY07-71]BCJ71071.1 histidine kinase [Catellatospora sp. IY07-71]